MSENESSCHQEDPQKILIIRLSALGDVVLSSPAVRLIRERFPQAQIFWLTEAPYAPLIEGLLPKEGSPAIPIAYDKRGTHRGIGGWLRLRRELKAMNFGLVVDLQNKPKTALLKSLGRHSIAFKKRTFAQSMASLFGQSGPLKAPPTVQALAEALSPLEICLPPEGTEARKEALTPHLAVTPKMAEEAAQAGIPSKSATQNAPEGPLIGLAPGARWATKKWPAEKFAELARRFEADGARILLVGGRDDAPAFDAIRSGLAHPESSLSTERLSVAGLAGALAQTSLVVSNDSGPAHIAAALGIPTLAIFGPTDPVRWAPRGRCADFIALNLPCSPCSNFGTAACPLKTHGCMRQLSAEAVYERAAELIRRAKDC